MAIVFLDTGIIGLITSPRKQGIALECEQWVLGLLAKGVNIVSSEICDYEVRRNLILEANSLTHISHQYISSTTRPPATKVLAHSESHLKDDW
jgi:hypothetical protein